MEYSNVFNMAPKYSNILYFNIKPKMGKGLVGKEDGWIWGGMDARAKSRGGYGMGDGMEWGNIGHFD